jgi:hypothetical protein
MMQKLQIQFSQLINYTFAMEWKFWLYINGNFEK